MNAAVEYPLVCGYIHMNTCAYAVIGLNEAPTEEGRT